MRLYEKDDTLFVRMLRTAEDDGEGGCAVRYRDGAEFSAHLAADTGYEQSAAQRERVRGRYTLTIPVYDGVFADGDVFRRADDGQIFTVVGEMKKTPLYAGFSFTQITAEAWVDACMAESVRADGTEGGAA